MIDRTVKLFKVLADKSRLKLISTLLREPSYIELLSEKLGLNPSTVSFHLKKLEAIGLVHSKKEQYYVMYYINKDVLDIQLLDLISSLNDENPDAIKREEIYYQTIISNFFEGSKLKSLPVQRKKRQVVLKEIAKSFELNADYTEKEVNTIIGNFHEDFCTIRRDFISEKIFDRSNGIYKRIL
ncbi:MAG: metalloregulator ArsR/SmtB family transcription factor [Firmicutes bacterium]|nr:metalloregulator ArsR/SmtB family transcription factor [Bacillota bacterium]